MESDIARFVRYRNYAEELRIIATDRISPDDYDTLQLVASDYDRLARSVENIIKSRHLIDR